MDYDKQIYAIANLRKLVICRAKRVNNTLVYKERVAVVCPTRVTVYINPVGGVTKYEVTVEGSTLYKPIVIGPALLDEIADRLALEGVVYHRRLLTDTLSAIIQGFIRKNRAEIRAEIESPGFYLIQDKITPVKYSVDNLDVEKLKQALLLLDELANTWFKHVIDKFSSVIKWSILAPFNYVLKQRGKWLPWIYLYGDSATGKTTLGRIALKIWGLDSRHEKTGASIDTIARLGYVLSMSTFPVLINEPGGALGKEEIVEAIKNAVDTMVVRGKYVKGSYVEYPALTPVIFTSNRYMPRDDALVRRLKIIQFTFGEKIPSEKQAEFKEKVEPRLNTLSEIGKCIAKQVVEKQEILDPVELLSKCYEIANLEAAEWLKLDYNEVVDYSETIVEEFTERFKKYINDLYAKYVSRLVYVDERERAEVLTPDSVALIDKLKILVEKNMAPGIRTTGDNIVLTASFLREIGLENRISLKSLAEILGLEYKPIKIRKEVVKGVAMPLDFLKEIL
ncbi:MAG: hypothetical protein QW607_11380 [Desulfurococcaceae archaeon]